MLVRLDNNELVEYPDEVGALLLADPSEGDVPDFSLEELNCLISGGFAAIYDESLTLEKNIEYAIEHYTRWGKPTPSNLEKARIQIKYYKENIAPADIVSMDFELDKKTDEFQRNMPKVDVLIVENALTSPKKLLVLSENSEKTVQKQDENSHLLSKT